MATPEPLEPSRRLIQAAAAERERLVSELEKTEAQAATLQRKLDSLGQVAQRLRQRLALLEQLAGDAADKKGDKQGRRPRVVQRRPEPENGWLRGALIRQVAVRILASTDSVRTPIHYTDWLRLVEKAGYGVAGRDPAATFLTQIGRSPVVVRGDEPGTYMLDLNQTEQLRARLAMLNDELLALHHGQQTIEPIATARERRSQLITEIGALERALEEAIEALGADDGTG